jgi:hypothetical protein
MYVLDISGMKISSSERAVMECTGACGFNQGCIFDQITHQRASLSFGLVEIET